MQYYKEKVEKVLENLNSSKEGISPTEANKRLEDYGENKIKSEKKISPVKIFFKQNKHKMFAKFKTIKQMILSNKKQILTIFNHQNQH